MTHEIFLYRVNCDPVRMDDIGVHELPQVGDRVTFQMDGTGVDYPTPNEPLRVEGIHRHYDFQAGTMTIHIFCHPDPR